MQIPNLVNIANACVGWSQGYTIASNSAKEEEVTRGSNYMLASFYQTAQASVLFDITKNLASHVPNPCLRIAIKVGCSVGPWASLVFFPLCAAVTQEWYKRFAEITDLLVIMGSIQGVSTGLKSVALSQDKSLKGIAKRRVALRAAKIIDALFPLPRELSQRTITLCRWTSNHSGSVMRVASVIGGIAICIVSPYFGAGMMVALLYEVGKSHGLVHHRVCLAVERYGPSLAALGVILSGGGILMQIQSALILAQAFPLSHQFVQQQQDNLIKYLPNKLVAVIEANQNNPRFESILDPILPVIDGLKDFLERNGSKISLKEYDAPLQNNQQMDYDTIKKILDNDIPFELDCAHCPKGVVDIYNLEKNFAFNHLLERFDRAFTNLPPEEKQKKYEYLKRKCADDVDHFFGFLKAQCGVSLEALKAQMSDFTEKVNMRSRLALVEECIAKLAAAKNLTKEDYLIEWMRDQMKGLTQGLLGQIPVPGTAEDLEIAKQHMATALGFLGTIPEDAFYEDILLKMAIEGGKYCSRGLKRAGGELVTTIAQQKMQGAVSKRRRTLVGQIAAAAMIMLGASALVYQVPTWNIKFSAACVAMTAGGVIFKIFKIYQTVVKNAQSIEDLEGIEMRIRGALEQFRETITQEVYSRWIQSSIKQDVHVMDRYKAYFGLGFVPLSDAERRAVGLESIGIWNLCGQARQAMHLRYTKEMDDVVEECLSGIGATKVTNYYRSLILKNSLLSDKQKEEFEEYLCNFDEEDVRKRFGHLLLISLGVLKKPVLTPS